MTRVDFYIGREGSKRDQLACRLAEIAYERGHKVLIVAPKDRLSDLDALLWTFAPASFVPHGFYGQTDDPVLLAAEEIESGDVLIPLLPDAPQHAGGFARVIEIVGGSEAEKTASRQRFRYYRDKGFAPVVHNL